MKVLPIVILMSIVAGQSTRIEVDPNYKYAVNHRDGDQNTINHRNAWT